MKDNKILFIMRLVPILFVLIFLSNIFFKETTFLVRLVLLPFLVCIFTECLRTFFLIMGKSDLDSLFQKVYVGSFLTYWFGFLCFFCYLIIRDKAYSSLFFVIPFWLIGIHLLYQTFFKKKVKSYKKHRQYNLKVIVSGLLVFSCFSLGVVMLFFGIRDTYRFFQATKGYVTTDGVFSDYEIYSDNGAEVTYQLTYTYRVDGIVYTIKTDYGTDYIPDRNSVREVRYNSNHPEEAVLVGSNNKNILIYFGAFFTLVSLTFVMAIFTTLGYFDKCRIDVMQTYIGVVFLIVGIGVICFQTGITGSVVKSIQSLGIFIMVPILFIIVGGMQIIKGVFSRDKKCHQDVKLEV